jgi:hypothetical protein
MTQLTSHLLPEEKAQVVYDTKSLIALFKDLEKRGYSGLGLGLIVDLIERDAHVSR